MKIRRFNCGLLLVSTAILAACVSPPVNHSPNPSIVDRDSLPPVPASEVPVSSRTSRAVADLVVGSQREYESGDWQSAIAVAERALRIDRRQPGVYLIIAKSYRAMGNAELALQFVEQGLRYVSNDNSTVGRELNWLSEALQ